MKTAIIFRWKRPNPGRESETMAFARESDEKFNEWQESGRCGPHMWIGSMGNEEDPMFVVWGEALQLVQLSSSPEFQALFMKGILLNEEFRFTFSVAGDTIDETWPAYAEAAG